MVIQVGDSTATVKQEISNLLEYVTGDGEITSWLNATNRINEVADIVGRDGIADGMAGATARARINALWDGPVWAPGADLAMDFREGLYYRGTPTDTHATDILALGSGGYETFAPNVLPRTDLGLLTTVGRTNKCTNYNANPTDLTGVNKSGDAAATLTVVDDSVELAAAGLSEICASGMAYVLDNSAGTGSALVTIGSTGNTNTHTASGFVRGSGSARVRLSGILPAYTSLQSTYEQMLATGTPGGSAAAWHVEVQAGAVVYFILNQLEEGPFATDPIITEGSAVTRPGNMPVIDLTGRLGEGVAGVIQFDWKALQDITFPFTFSDGTAANRLRLQYNTGGGISLFNLTGDVDTPAGGAQPTSSGLNTIAFAAGPDFLAFQIVGSGEAQIKTTAFDFATLDRLGIGGRGYNSNSNIYAQFKRLALQFGPQNQASFDAMYALAQQWAAQ